MNSDLDRLAEAAAAAAPPPTDKQIRALRRLFSQVPDKAAVLPLRARPSRQDRDRADRAERQAASDKAA